ncbi:hypothetical protein DFJ58DRAFT_771681 [Suillus subalutaceus]|uniref:uncharacterized protein n=1 Tax=Suillus subalutaceus TaxID=48586 RepID=UPI001B870E93|nr:uncharacterized protein DFJ58DRAFT_771681 [Suillus subalutaceus]KAG1864942.1 hypothetical protein DFJ58DRAFT_771681 [Suillus subalutaceus]
MRKTGHGHTVNYLDHSRVTKYVAVEPNVHMHAELRRTASAAGYNTLISVLTICSIPSPQSTISGLVTEVLKPGGQMLFYEHVLSERKDVVWWQRFWTPLWSFFFDGCCLDRPSHRWIEGVGGWVQGEGGIWGKEGETEEHLSWHRAGRLVKA